MEMEAVVEPAARTWEGGASSTMMRGGRKLVLACSAHHARNVATAMAAREWPSKMEIPLNHFPDLGG